MNLWDVLLACLLALATAWKISGLVELWLWEG